MRGRKLRTNILKFSLSKRCASAAMVSKTSDDLPEPDIPVKMVILRLGIFKVTSLRLFSRAPRISIYSCIITPYADTLPVFHSLTIRYGQALLSLYLCLSLPIAIILDFEGSVKDL